MKRVAGARQSEPWLGGGVEELSHARCSAPASRHCEVLASSAAKDARDAGAERARPTLGEELELAHFVIEHAMDPIHLVDSEGIIVSVNEASTRMFGFAREQLEGARVTLIDPELTSEAWRTHWNELRDRGSLCFERALRRKSGSTLPVEIKANYLTFRGRELNCAILRDVSARKRAEASLAAARECEERARILREHKEQLELVLESTQVGFWEWNPLTDELSVSRRWAEMLGYRPEELRTDSAFIRALFHQDDLPAVQASLARHVAGETAHFEAVHRMRHRDGRWVYMLNRGRLLARDELGRPVRFCGTHTDITREKTAEQVALSASQAKSELIANMSHELRTPLNAILGLSEALLEKAYGPVNRRQLESLRTIHGSGQHLLALIGDLLDIARVEAGQLPLDLRDVDLAALGADCTRLVEASALEKGIAMRLAFPDASVRVRADARRLKQLVLNLLTNAIELSPQGAVVTTGARVVSASIAELWVADTGPGIAAKDHARIFDPFVTLRATSEGRHGTGLGLAVVRRIAEAHGGSVRVESSEGRGACFIASLPRTATPIDPTAPGAAAKSVARAQSGTRRRVGFGRAIVLAQGHASHALAVDGELEARGYDVRSAHDFESGLEAVTAPGVALAVIDVHSPELDGLEMIRRIRATKGCKRLPVIALTTGVTLDEERCVEAGASMVLTKPVNGGALAQLADELVKHTKEGHDVDA